MAHRWKYDVFVSFRGEDIRRNFMDHLFKDFKQKGIHAFRDDNELPRGEEISPHLYKAIEESRFLIVIFSKNYASSSWCLRELVKILECKHNKNPKYEVRIIFYDVKPDVVRKQKRSYAEAFRNHEVSNILGVGKWKEALSMAGDLSGFDLQDMTNGYESKFIDCISKDILKKLCDGPLHVGENLVGIEFYFERLDLPRFVGSDKVNMIGICGISGIGKTTLAKVVYNSMHTHFDDSCFCDNVQGVGKQKGLMKVQMQMIGKILKTEDFTISSVAEGAMIIKQRMAYKRILVVFDDVDDHKQLDSLAGSTSWFRPGSLIIFTGKDKQLLRSHGVNEIHDMKFLDEHQSLQLFCSYAFKTKDYSRGFKEIAEKVVKYVQGHPLGLIVLGRFLYGKTMGQWVSELDQLKVHPNKEIQQMLRLSYNGLNLHQQNILLDIACSFIGVNRDFAASILDGCNFFADTNIQVLVDKSLITISSDNLLQMHDLIEAMAREIVYEESSVPGSRSRLWVDPSEIYHILSENKATQAVEILDIQQNKSCQKFDIDGKAFAQMKNLRILKLPMDYEVNFHGRLDFLSNKLILLYWHGCPFKLLPSDFYPENIVTIDLSYSNIKQLWTTPKYLRRLKIMKLRYCCNLTTTPNFYEITSLEELDLEGCANLITIHPSIGMLKRLIVLNMRYCKRAFRSQGWVNINQPPEAFWSRWWTSIPGFIWKQPQPERSVSLEGFHMLKSLDFSYCNLVQVPESIGGLSCLKELNLMGNNLLEVPESIGGLSCLEELHLSGNNFSSLPRSLSQLSHLNKLRLEGCKKLEVLPELPPSIRMISAFNCTSLREVSGSSKDPFKCRHIYFLHCLKLFDNVSIDSDGSNHQLSAFLGYLGFESNRCEFFLQIDRGYSGLHIIYHANSMPDWFTNRSTGNQVKVELPSDSGGYNKFRGYGFCVVFKCKKPFKKFTEWYSVKNFDGALITEDFPSYELECGKGEDYIWLLYLRDTEGWEEAKNSVTFCFHGFSKNDEYVEMKECGVRLIYDEDIKQEAHLSMLHGLPTPTQPGGLFGLYGVGQIYWSW